MNFNVLRQNTIYESFLLKGVFFMASHNCISPEIDYKQHRQQKSD